jgi:hypothetical protein
VLGIGADDSHHAPTLYDLALFATPLNGWLNFHLDVSPIGTFSMIQVEKMLLML